MESCRPAVAADVGRIADLARLSLEEQRGLKGGELWSTREARAEPLDESFKELLDRDDALVIVGTIDEAIIGFGAVVIETLRTGDLLGVITELFVEAEARAVGVGESMMRALIAFCDDAGCIGIDAWALPGHRDTKNFFEGSGFSARGIVMHRPAHRDTNER